MVGDAPQTNSEKVRGLLLLLIEQVIPLRKPLMRLIEPKFVTLFCTVQQ
jgi:hypothetical protein